ncbi:MAG: hypothetical protein E7233_13475 [Lachnospiraceae bacterium]|nr:hypothetical protein [Sarcina sp.]MBE6018591.1 hypothetical protein [Lachnospiraceae bacterium]MBR3187105.1 hypothetical protein [Lachnospiraceae bacterium]
MGVKIFREENWDRIEAGMISLWDIRDLDRRKDRRLIEYLILKGRDRLKEKVMRQYGITEMPEEPVNIDDPDDEIYRTYYVLCEQVEREDDVEALKASAFRKYRDSRSTFAFCYLTGYSWPPSECDAYSYRTYDCGRCKDMTDEDNVDFCIEMIRRSGPFAREAEEVLQRLGIKVAIRDIVNEAP